MPQSQAAEPPPLKLHIGDPIASSVERLNTVAVVARVLDTSVSTVRRKIATGELEAVRLGYRTVRVSDAALAAYIAANTGRVSSCG